MKNIREYGMYIALGVIIILFAIFTSGTFITPENISNLLKQCAYIAVLAVGMTLVIIIKHIDLSVGYIAGFLGAIAALLMTKSGVNTWFAIVIILLIGAAIGLMNGLLVAKVGVPAFVVTLAGMLAFHGLLQIATEGTGSIIIPNRDFVAIGDGYIPDIFGGKFHVLTLIIGILGIALYIIFQFKARSDKIRYEFEVPKMSIFLLKLAAVSAIILVIVIVLAGHNGIPWPVVVVGGVVFIFHFIMTKTTLGRHIYGIGGNGEAAELSGVSVKKVTVFVFVAMSTMAALSGVLYAARLHSATTTAGNGFELDAIAAAYVGGVSAGGGVGKVTNSIIGALVMASLINGMKLMGTGESFQYVIRGIILVLAVVFDLSTRRQKAKVQAKTEAAAL